MPHNVGDGDQSVQKKLDNPLESGDIEIFHYLTGLDLQSFDRPAPIMEV